MTSHLCRVTGYIFLLFNFVQKIMRDLLTNTFQNCFQLEDK